MYDLVSFVLRGKFRKKILIELKTPKTPTQLSKKLAIHRSNISRGILELEKKGMLICLTPNEEMGRLYQISEIGKSVLERMENDKI